MRSLMLLLMLAAAGLTTYGLTLGKTSFSAYDEAQLDTLDAEYARLDERGELSRSLAFSRKILQSERQRRLYVPLAGGVAALAAVGFVLTFRKRRPVRTDDEDARLAIRLGDPALVLEGAKNKAAALLGVSRDAPPFVVEAALEAQLRQREPAALAGLAPDLRSIVQEQREELIKARDLLLRRDG